MQEYGTGSTGYFISAKRIHVVFRCLCSGVPALNLPLHYNLLTLLFSPAHLWQTFQDIKPLSCSLSLIWDFNFYFSDTCLSMFTGNCILLICMITTNCVVIIRPCSWYLVCSSGIGGSIFNLFWPCSFVDDVLDGSGMWLENTISAVYLVIGLFLLF